VDKQFLYPLCIVVFFILQHIHARIYKVHINSNRTYIRLSCILVYNFVEASNYLRKRNTSNIKVTLL
jgi:hypothetical protein